MTKKDNLKEVIWVGSSRKDMRKMPPEVRRVFGVALTTAQMGEKPPDAKPVPGIAAGVVEIVEDYLKNTYRAFYTVRLKDKIYVLHVFKKKSKKGIATPMMDLNLVKTRLKDAEKIHSGKR